MIVGIDATNLRGGGGVTHLVELLRTAKPLENGFSRIVVWGGELTLNRLEERPWLRKCNPAALNRGLLKRSFWQRFHLSKAARDEGCDVLFVPGGSYAGDFHPVVTMSQNLLPFELPELRRYGWTLFKLKLLLLRWMQSRSFRQSAGVIFLTKYARDVVLGVTGKLRGQNCIVPHGISSRFNSAPKPQRSIADCDDANPYRVLYVSIIDQYKHQWHVVEAVAALRQQGLPLALDLIGPAYPPALRRLTSSIDHFDSGRAWVHYHGSIPFDELHLHYMQADLGLFASSCENMPNILLETMASGLPIACSNRGPMPEILCAGGIYFDPEKATDIARALRKFIESPQLRIKCANMAYQCSKKYTWEVCSFDTFKFITKVISAERDKRLQVR